MEAGTYDAPCIIAVFVVVAASVDVVVAVDDVDVGQSQSGKITKASSTAVLFTE